MDINNFRPGMGVSSPLSGVATGAKSSIVILFLQKKKRERVLINDFETFRRCVENDDFRVLSDFSSKQNV